MYRSTKDPGEIRDCRKKNRLPDDNRLQYNRQPDDNRLQTDEKVRIGCGIKRDITLSRCP